MKSDETGHAVAANGAGSRRTGAFSVLVAEDEEAIAESMICALREEGFEVVWVRDGAQALRVLEHVGFDLVVSDVRMPFVDGLTVLKELQERSAHVPVILMSAYGTIRQAVAAVQEHAMHYLPKPFELDELLEIVRSIAARSARARAAPHAGEESAAFAEMVGDSPAMALMRKHVLAAAGTDAPILIHGPNGSGKELVARSIHELGARGRRPFVAVNCASIPEALFEAEMFGHERGAFTGAVKKRPGLFCAAHEGTIFLDEIGEVPLQTQPKLLRVLQENVVQPLGSDREVRVDARVLAATNVDLRAAIAQKRFREDLYYRVRVLDIRVPALKERMSDLPALIAHFLRVHGGAQRNPLRDISPRAWAALASHDFPGNVRELEHAIRRGLTLAGDAPLDVGHLPEEMRADRSASGTSAELAPLSDAIAQFERQYLLSALDRAGSKTAAAELLGISRKNMWEKLKRHGL